MTNKEFIEENLKKPEAERLSLSTLCRMGILIRISASVWIKGEEYVWDECYDPERISLGEVFKAAPLALQRALDKAEKEAADE